MEQQRNEEIKRRKEPKAMGERDIDREGCIFKSPCDRLKVGDQTGCFISKSRGRMARKNIFYAPERVFPVIFRKVFFGGMSCPVTFREVFCRGTSYPATFREV